MVLLPANSEDLPKPLRWFEAVKIDCSMRHFTSCLPTLRNTKSPGVNLVYQTNKALREMKIFRRYRSNKAMLSRLYRSIIIVIIILYYCINYYNG